MTQSVFDLIDLRSFSSIWYWVLLALTWARVTQAPMGVAYDMVERARKSPQIAEDLLAVTAVQVRRRGARSGDRGALQVGIWAFALSVLAGLGLGYGSELALSVFLIVAPLALVQGLSQRAARDLAATGPDLDAVLARLRRLKRRVQIVALLAVFVTAVLGMYHNLATSAL